MDLRVSTMPGRHGEKTVIRVIDSRQSIVPLERLGMDEVTLSKWMDIVRRPNGIALVTGPTGSGKSTTLYSVLALLNEQDANLSTVEDPIEATLAGVNQFQVNEKAGFGFAIALRSLLRQDPDTIMVGEIRDEETASVAVQAALTGHLVLSSLHTNDATAAVTRLVNIGVEPYLVAATVRGVLAQRLVRKICPHCRTRAEPDALTIAAFAQSGQAVAGFSKGAGCVRCRSTGFAGRIGVFEIMVPTEEFNVLVARGASLQELHAYLATQGHRLLRDDAFRKVSEGLTTVEEAIAMTAH